MAAPASSFKAVATALAANSLVTVAKFSAFAVSGSASMLSESIHSLADAANQFLLLTGLKRGAREGDRTYQFGYGAERFVFGILSAAGIFFIGCGVTVWHGVTGLLNPHPAEIGWLTWAVLGFSLVVEGGSTLVAVLAVRTEAAGTPFFQYVKTKADPAAVAILLEDAAAVLGLLLAALAIVLFAVTGNPIFDSLGSICVGLILGWVAFHLVSKNRELLLGKAIPPESEERFVAVLRAHPGVALAKDIKTRQLTPESYMLKAEISLDEGHLAGRISSTLPTELPLSAEDRTATATLLAKAAIGAVSDIIDELEAAIRKQVPEARHIYLEVDHLPDRATRQPEPAAGRKTGS